MKYTSKKVLAILAFLLVQVFVNTVNAQKNSEFRVMNDGQIEIQERFYSDMSDYVSSDAFRERGARCGVDISEQRFAVSSTENARDPSDCNSVRTRILAEYEPSVLMTIPVWFHVIMNSSGQGTVTDSEIADQIKVLNEDFQALTGTVGQNSIDIKLEFVLAGTTRTTNNAWYSDSETDELAYKTALGKDQNKYLNIYSNDASGYLGYAYFPGASGSVYDGVVILSESVGGRNNGFSLYDQGRTLVHEIGHYLGLYHTFNNGSSCPNGLTSGDLIADTNAEFEPFYGNANGSCSIGRTSCGNADPVSNYMDYNIDNCMTEFTSQQANRMLCAAINYRPDLLTVVAKNGNIVPILQLLLDDEI